MVRAHDLAILGAAIAAFLLGGVWYRLLFREPVRREMAPKVRPPDLAIAFVRGLIMVWALSMVMAQTGARSWSAAVDLALLVWFGFMAPAQLSETIFGGRSWRIYLVNTGYPLVVLLVAASIYALWA